MKTDRFILFDLREDEYLKTLVYSMVYASLPYLMLFGYYAHYSSTHIVNENTFAREKRKRTFENSKPDPFNKFEIWEVNLLQ